MSDKARGRPDGGWAGLEVNPCRSLKFRALQGTRRADFLSSKLVSWWISFTRGTTRVVACVFRRQETSWWHPSSCTDFFGSYMPSAEALWLGFEA